MLDLHQIDLGRIIEYDHEHRNGEVTKGIRCHENLRSINRVICLCYECSGLMNPDGSYKSDETKCSWAAQNFNFVCNTGIMAPIVACPKFSQVEPL